MILLGCSPDFVEDYIGVQINFSWFLDTFGRNRDIDEEGKSVLKEDDEKVARTFLFCLIAGQLFYNSSGSRGYVYML